MFYGKAVLRLALVHSKYIGHGKIAKNYSSAKSKDFLRQLSESVALLKVTLSNPNCSEDFHINHREKPVASLSASGSTKEPSYRRWMCEFLEHFSEHLFS